MMASWLTHLRIAEKIKQKIKDIDLSYLMVGSSAPDAALLNTAKSDSLPSKEEFYSKHLIPEKLFLRSDMTRSFLWGYYFNLLTDQLWTEQFVKPLSTDYAEKYQNPEKCFSDFIEEEQTAIDFTFLKENGYGLLEAFKNSEINLSYFNDFDQDGLPELKDRIMSYYNKNNLVIDSEYEYLNKELMDGFVNMAAENCIGMLL